MHPCRQGYGYELQGGAHIYRDGALHIRHRRASCLAHSTGRDEIHDRDCTSRPPISSELGASRILRWYPSSLGSIRLLWRNRPSLRPARILRRVYGGTIRRVMQRNKEFVQAHNRPSRACCFASIAYRATFAGEVAAGFVRRISFSLKLVCRTRLDRDFRTWGGSA
jgi:hypothetical protein